MKVGKNTKYKMSPLFLIVIAVVLVSFASVEWQVMTNGAASNSGSADVLAATALSKTWPPLKAGFQSALASKTQVCAVFALPSGGSEVDCAKAAANNGYSNLVVFTCKAQAPMQNCASPASTKKVVVRMSGSPVDKCTAVCGAGPWTRTK